MGISQINPPSIAEERRNRAEGEKILIKLFDTNDSSIFLKTVPGGGSETRFSSNGIEPDQIKIMTLPSRRSFPPLFSKGRYYRKQFIQHKSCLSNIFNFKALTRFLVGKNDPAVELFRR